MRRRGGPSRARWVAAGQGAGEPPSRRRRHVRGVEPIPEHGAEPILPRLDLVPDDRQPLGVGSRQVVEQVRRDRGIVPGKCQSSPEPVIVGSRRVDRDPSHLLAPQADVRAHPHEDLRQSIPLRDHELGNQRRGASVRRRRPSTHPAPAPSTITAVASEHAGPRHLIEYRRLAMAIIRRWGVVQSARSVRSRMRAHSANEGRLRCSGLATQSEARSSSASSARPLRVSRRLRVSQSRNEWTR